MAVGGGVCWDSKKQGRGSDGAVKRGRRTRATSSFNTSRVVTSAVSILQFVIPVLLIAFISYNIVKLTYPQSILLDC